VSIIEEPNVRAAPDADEVGQASHPLERVRAATVPVVAGSAPWQMLLAGPVVALVTGVAAREQPARPAVGLQRHYLSLKALIRSA